ncbi:MAG: hypothetical protein FH756_19510 [Firmicutes bacterium]|nr:hypothetical protein [Bacillota bacterium]
MSAYFNLNALEKLLNDICRKCDQDAQKCNKATCLAGFALWAVKFVEKKNNPVIPGASGYIPMSDFKPYYADDTMPAVAETCLRCKECRDNHTDDCIIALVRHCLELALWGEQLSYPGSVFQYMALLKERDMEGAAALAVDLRRA